MNMTSYYRYRFFLLFMPVFAVWFIFIGNVQANEHTVPDYGSTHAWAYRQYESDKAVDLFIIAPTVELGDDGSFNADVSNKAYRQKMTGALNMQLGIYNAHTAVFSPFYRQATLAVYRLDEQDRQKYMDIAYRDILAAWQHFVNTRDMNRPIIIAGFSQGAEMALRLLKACFADPTYQKRLVAAYLIGWRITPVDIEAFAHLKMAQGQRDTGVIISFNSESERIHSSLLVGKDQKTYAINPLNWKTDSTIASKTLNSGACFTDYSGGIQREIPNLTGAYIDEQRGTLKVMDVSERDYPGVLFEDGVFHLYDYQFFYRNLQDNVRQRIRAYFERR